MAGKHIKLMDPEATLKLLEGRKDIITPLAEAREAFYQSQTCIRCGSPALIKVGDANTMFRSNEPLPRYLLKCASCECLFDPHSGLLLSMGNQAKALVPSVPILKGPED